MSRPNRPSSSGPPSPGRVALGVLLAVALLLPPAAGATTVPAGVTPVSGSVTFHGLGYGHGVGMSQYGARGRALAGQPAGAILAHYYRGTTVGTVSPRSPVRVLLLSGWRASPATPLAVTGRGGEWTIDGIAGRWPADARLTLTPSTSTTQAGATVTWRLKVLGPTGTLLHDAARSSASVLRPGSAATSFEVAAKPTGRNRYRGLLRVLPRTDAATLSAVNELTLDMYLRGVVPVEMPSSWPVEALRAQAIVARSYAAARLRPGVSYWDVYDDTRSQVYHGLLGERAATDAAIVATAGQVVRRDGAIATTVFHSTAGGHTEHNENVFVSATGAKVAAPVAYLRGVSDRAPDGTAYDAGAPYARWTSSTWSVSALSTWLGADARTNVGALLGLDLRDRGVSGRLVSVTLHGSAGVRRVSADVFRSVINGRKPAGDRPIRSSLFALTPLP